MTQRRSGWLIDWLVICSYSTLDLACHMDKQDILKIQCRTTCTETHTTHMTFLNIDFRISREMAKPLLEAVAPLVPAICAKLSATTFYTATSSASKRLDTEDIVYALYAATLLIKVTKDLLLILHQIGPKRLQLT